MGQGVSQEARTAVGITGFFLLLTSFASIIWWLYTHRFRNRLRYIRTVVDQHRGNLCGLSFVYAAGGSYFQQNQQGMHGGNAAVYCADKKFEVSALPEVDNREFRMSDPKLRRWVLLID